MAIDPCTEYGLALAAEDFVPVVLAGLGALALADACGRRVPSVRAGAMIGSVLITLGGLGKATWKVLVAAEPCHEVPILEQALFPCLAFGFAALAWSVVALSRGTATSPARFAAVPVLGAAGAFAVGALWPMLVVAAVGAVVVGITASRHAFVSGLSGAGWLYIAYVVGTLVLPPLAARPDQSEGLQWIEQLTNSTVQACFLFGALALRRHLSPTPTQTAGASL